MNESKTPIAGRGGSTLLRAAAAGLAVVVVGTAVITGPAVKPTRAILDLAATTYTAAQSAAILGRDGRFTILLLGSDARAGRLFGRTDAILVASVNPATGHAAVFSIPRDTVNFPLSARTKYPGKINALFPYLVSRYGRESAGRRLRGIIGHALQVEIDAYALIGFTGFRRLVDTVGGVDVYVARTLRDPKYTILVNGVRRRITFYAGWNHLTNQRALAYARIRYVDSDYARARRQQQLIIAAITKVLSLGPDAAIPSLLAASTGVVKTDLRPADWPLIYAMVGRANLRTARRVVFGPRAYAYSAGIARIALRLPACRAWIRNNFPPIHPGSTWLPPEPAPVVADPTPTPVVADPTPTPVPAP
jgi:LCP family protein required for cell wall assembly